MDHIAPPYQFFHLTYRIFILPTSKLLIFILLFVCFSRLLCCPTLLIYTPHLRFNSNLHPNFISSSITISSIFTIAFILHSPSRFTSLLPTDSIHSSSIRLSSCTTRILSVGCYLTSLLSSLTLSFFQQSILFVLCVFLSADIS